MRNNKPTYIFLAVLLAIFASREFFFGHWLDWSPITTLCAFITALWTTISFFEYINQNQWVVKKLPFLAVFTQGSQIGFWWRQLIFFSGFGIGFLFLKLG